MTAKTTDNNIGLLVDAFEQDHRLLTQGLDRVLRQVRSREYADATSAADELDQIAGPHISFEEEIFYPTLERTLGQAFVSRLFDEHDAGKQALRVLIDHRDCPETLEAERADLISRLETALEHALSCGTLLSHLASLDGATILGMLRQLEDLRQQGRRWTDRPDGA
jgi:hypothetical protein